MEQPIARVDLLSTLREQARGLLFTMRPAQWTKNLILFAGLIFSDERLFLQAEPLLRSVTAFLLFSLLASAVYLMNDLMDVERDRAHPSKRSRPLPSGRLNVWVARAALAALLATTLPAAFLLAPLFGVALAAYLLNNITYNLVLKHTVLLDVFSIAAGFVLRAMAGALVLSVAISPWLYALTLLLALFLGFSKRHHELLLLRDGRGTHRRVLEEYSPGLLEEMRNIITASIVIAYALYTFTAPNLPDNHTMMLTIPFVLYGLFRYMLITREDGGAPPDELLLRDRPLLLTVILWGLTAIAILLLHHTP